MGELLNRECYVVEAFQQTDAGKSACPVRRRERWVAPQGVALSPTLLAICGLVFFAFILPHDRYRESAGRRGRITGRGESG
jgi:hypothetical protein